MHVSPYLNFNGRCEEAVTYYKTALGAEVEMLMRFSDAPQGGPHTIPEAAKSKIMHTSFKIGDTAVMASDGMCTEGSQTKFDGFHLSLNVPDVATAERLFAALAADGEVTQPLTETFFAPRFGMVVDKLGVGWMVVAAASPA